MTVLLSFLGLFTPFIYLCGESYYEGYFAAYGMSSENFPIDTAKTYVFAYSASIHFAVLTVKESLNLLLLFLPASVIAIFLLLSLSHLIERNRETPLPKPLNSLRLKSKRYFIKHHIHIERLDRFFDVIYYILFSLGFVMVLAILWVMIPQLAYEKGTSIQKKKIQTYLEQGCYIKENSWNMCHKITDANDSVHYEGLLIANTNEKIAMFIDGKSIIFENKPEYIILRDSNMTKKSTTKDT